MMLEVYVIDVDGGDLVNVTDSPANEEAFDWSPDGSRIVFDSERDGNTDVYVVDADGTDPTRLTIDPAYDGGPAWSPGSDTGLAAPRAEE